MSKEIGNLWVFHRLSLPGFYDGLVVAAETDSFTT